jgi:hypothetical protein
METKTPLISPTTGYQIVNSETLRNNLDRLVTKIKKNFFNIIIIFGATRTGKSTIATQIGYYMSHHLGNTFTSQSNIFFNVDELVEEGKKGVKNAVYQLDEAAFDLKGTDWAKSGQKQLLVLFNTAAMYNQTYIIIIPKLEELRSHFISDEHTCGLEVYYNKRTFERGFYKAYTSEQLMYKYMMLKNLQYQRAMRSVFSFHGRFNKYMDFVDEEEYVRKKIDAINKIGEAQSDDKTKIKLQALRAKIAHLPYCYKISDTDLWFFLGYGGTIANQETGEEIKTSNSLKYWRGGQFTKFLTESEKKRINDLMLSNKHKFKVE